MHLQILFLLITVFCLETSEVFHSDREIIQGLQDEMRTRVAELDANGDATEIMGVNIERIMEQMEAYKQSSEANGRTLYQGVGALSSDCLNLKCDFFFYFLTCKAFGINMHKVCAGYFVGRFYFNVLF